MVTDMIDRTADNTEQGRNLLVCHGARHQPNLPHLVLGQLPSVDVAPKDVDGLADSFQVVWIDACPVSTGVIKHQTVWDRSIESFVDDAVCVTSISPGVASVLVDAQLPHPAAGLGINDVVNIGLPLQPGVVLTDEEKRFALLVSPVGSVLLCKASPRSAAALAKPTWDRIVLHFSESSNDSGGAVPGAFAALPGVSCVHFTRFHA